MRLIDADTLKPRVFIANEFNRDTGKFRLPVVSWLDIEDADTIEAEPVRHSYWTRDGECNNCGELGLYNGNEELVRVR